MREDLALTVKDYLLLGANAFYDESDTQKGSIIIASYV
jgi:hypothetical protein